MRNIVLLSDGTGNGAAKRNRTNVWRLYQALDLHRPDQVAFYDDGVGSQEFLPLKILGGVFGFGMKRNVIELYKFLCRNYEQGDKIYLFGFSRGAFTVRVLAGMIAFCGLYGAYGDDRDLHKTARRNYSAFRSRFEGGLLNRLWRTFSRAPREPVSTTTPDIEFVGVWDTVDAYGLPIDELAVLWDKLIIQIRFPDRELSPKVKRACHAVAVDDERLTFHPVLWNESNETDLNRIEQVWFSGVHSDVGGGYPMYDLSLVTLDWMMSKAEAPNPTSPGLHFIPRLRDETVKHSDWHGMQHDSRAGLAAYYRYKPRSVAQLCDDSTNKVKIETPKIHRGVLERIKGNSIPYAPAGVPASYEVVTTRGPAYQYEAPDQAQRRANALNAALDVVYWRRWLYTALLGATLVLACSPFYLDWKPGGICQGQACLLDPALALAEGVLPDFTSRWFDTLRQNPEALWGFLGTFIILFLFKRALSAATGLKANSAWSALKGRGSPPSWTPTFAFGLRQAAQSQLKSAVNWVAAGAVFVLLLVALFVLVGRASIYARSTLGWLCEGGGPEIRLGAPLTFDIVNPCFPTGIKLKAGTTYRFEVQDAAWMDGTQSSGPDGFELTKLKHLVPLRRRVSEPWLKLLGRIGDNGQEEFVIGAGPRIYTAKSSGELFLYVNDAVFGLGPGSYWAWPYFWSLGRNAGTASVTVTETPECNLFDRCNLKDEQAGTQSDAP